MAGWPLGGAGGGGGRRQRPAVAHLRRAVLPVERENTDGYCPQRIVGSALRSKRRCKSPLLIPCACGRGLLAPVPSSVICPAPLPVRVSGACTSLASTAARQHNRAAGNSLLRWPRGPVPTHSPLVAHSQAYVWCEPGDPASVLPARLAVPWVAVAHHLGMPPAMTYASYALYDWRRLDPEGPVALGNLVSLQVMWASVGTWAGLDQI